MIPLPLRIDLSLMEGISPGLLFSDLATQADSVKFGQSRRGGPCKFA
jgi:hypothetical protein